MNSQASHWSNEDLSAFISGELTEVKTENILTHLETCEHCLAIVDALWEEGGWQDANSDPQLEKERAAQIEQRLYGRIHRSQLAGDVIAFGTRGMLEMTLALLAPFIGILTPSNSKSARPKERK